jgi:tetratricopeptide (TPR) repeat protein
VFYDNSRLCVSQFIWTGFYIGEVCSQFANPREYRPFASRSEKQQAEPAKEKTVLTKDAWFNLADQCSKNHGGNDCLKVTSNISPALRDALKSDYRTYVNRCNDHKGDESACNIAATMNTTLIIAGCRQLNHLDTDDWTCSGVSDASQSTVVRVGDVPFSMDQCRIAKEPAVKVEQCSTLISKSADPKILEKALNRRGHAYMGLKRFAEAANDFTAVIRLNPRIAGYYDNRQNALRALGRLDDALADANKAVRLAPTYSFVYIGRGHVFADMGRYDPALQDYTTAISLDPKNAGLFVSRGKIFVETKRLREAIADFTRALEIDSTMTAAMRERGLTYKLQGNFNAARSDLSVILRVEPNDGEIVQALQDMTSDRDTGRSAESMSPQIAPNAGCSSIANPQERLNCYDKLSGRTDATPMCPSGK